MSLYCYIKEKMKTIGHVYMVVNILEVIIGGVEGCHWPPPFT